MQTDKTKLAVMQEQIKQLHENVETIKVDIHEIKAKLDDVYVRKEDFFFWRNILISGILVSLAVGVMLNLIKK